MHSINQTHTHAAQCTRAHVHAAKPPIMAQRTIRSIFAVEDGSDANRKRSATDEGSGPSVESNSKHRKTEIHKGWSRDFPCLLVSDSENDTQLLLCSLCRKTQSRNKRCAIGIAV